MTRSTLRRWIAGAGYATGMTQLASRAGDHVCVVRDTRGFSIRKRRRDPFLVLLYHRVNPGKSRFSIERIPPESFSKQMEYLARHFHVLPLEEIITRLRSGEPLPPRAIAVTFDDGYEDNYIHAFPVLRHLGLPATIFLTTVWIDTKEIPWFDRVLHAFANTTRDSVALPAGGETVRLEDVESTERAAFRALDALKRLSNSERIEAIEGLVSFLLAGGEASPPRNQMLHWEQIREMSKFGITMGAHTVTHPILTRIQEDDVRRELAESKRRIEAETGRPVTLFAYPVGRSSDYSPAVLKIVGETGFEAALTTCVGVNTRGDDLFLVRRVKPLGNDVPSFALGLMIRYMTEWSASG